MGQRNKAFKLSYWGLIMRGQAMRKIIQILKKKGVNLSSMRALEVFAREGDWQTMVYANEVKTLEAWEINPIFLSGLRRNLPNAEIKITDSIQEIKKKKYFGKFDFIVIDNPQNCYGPQNRYCEHFDIMPEICNLLDSEGIIVFNVNKQPFDIEKFQEWQTRRGRFYGLKNTNKISVQWLLDFYKKMFEKFGYVTEFCFNVSRGDIQHNDYLHYLVYYLKLNQGTK